MGWYCTALTGIAAAGAPGCVVAWVRVAVWSLLLGVVGCWVVESCWVLASCVAWEIAAWLAAMVAACIIDALCIGDIADSDDVGAVVAMAVPW